MNDRPAGESSLSYLPWHARTRVELKGPDAQSFLHRFCTNDIVSLTDGHGCEAFLTTVQGKTMGHLLVAVTGDSVMLETVPGQAETIIAHLDRYAFSEQLEMIDRTDDSTQWLLQGPSWSDQFDWPSAGSGTNFPAMAGEIESRITVAPYVSGGCWLLRVATTDAPDVEAWLKDLAATPLEDERFQWLRIQAGFPLFGIDFSPQQLPQELDRNEAAISFTKGCYLGQETVARLDALGHVNKLLKRLEFDAPLADPTGEILFESQPVGQLTSHATCGGRTIGLAILKRPAFEAGKEVSLNGQVGVVQ